MIREKNDLVMKTSFIKVIKFKLNTKKLFAITIFVIILYTLSNIHLRHETTKKSSSNSRVVLQQQSGSPFLNRIDIHRIGRLFDILQAAEDKYFANGRNPILNEKLDLISFERIKHIKNTESNSSEISEPKGDYGRFKYEINSYLAIDSSSGKLKPSEKFINYLYNKSVYFSYKKPRNQIVLNRIQSDSKPVILMSANYKYFEPLKNSLRLLRKNFPDLEIIVYDMGFTTSMAEEIVELCNCNLRKFDPDGLYETVSPHSANLNTYTWKPLIIQEILKDHETVIYIDTSIKFVTDKIDYIVETAKDVGMLSRYIGLYVKCFTDERMFDWFQEPSDAFANIYSLEANLLIFHRSFLTSLIMKAWVSCALERDCIAPPGAHIYGGPSNWINGCGSKSCGCHRFDQDALAIVTTYFYGFPENYEVKPAFTLTNKENYFYNLTRRNIPQYIRDQIFAFFIVLFPF